MKREQGRKGFTIVELVIVIGVIAILAAVIIPTFTGVIESAKEAADKQTVNIINKMLKAGEINSEKIKEYEIKKSDWELAYSEKLNEVIIVNKSGEVIVSQDDEMIGRIINEEYVRVSEIGKTPSRNEGDSGKAPIEEEDKGNWENAEHISGDIDGEEIKGKAEIYIEDSVGSMPESCFANSDKIERVYIGEGITKITSNAFDGCLNLKEVYIAGKGVEIGDEAFYGCVALEKINLNEVTGIGKRAFANCEQIREINTEKLERLGAYALTGCKGITNIELRENMEEMYYNSLQNCNLERLTIKGAIEIKESDGKECKYEVKELEIVSEEKIKIGTSMWLHIAQIINRNQDKMTKVRIRNVEIDASQRSIKPFAKLTKGTEIIIEDEASYISLLGTSEESKIFGGTVIKAWK